MGSRADLDEYGENKISSLAPPEFEPRTATPTMLRVFRTMSCVFLPHSIKFNNCKLWVLQIRNLERTWHTVGLPPLWRRYSWRLPFCLNSKRWQRTRILAACFPARLLVPQGLFAPLTEFRCVFEHRIPAGVANIFVVLKCLILLQSLEKLLVNSVTYAAL